MNKLGRWLKHLSLGKKVVLGAVIAFFLMAAAGAATTHITHKTVVETQTIPFTSTTYNDATLAKGTTKVTTAGVDGTKTLTYDITYTNGKQTAKTLKKTEITKNPVNQVTTVGTYVAPTQPKAQPQPQTAKQTPTSCDPNYTGACVPIASDVDCAGGSGNGPAYVQGPVHVVGADIYGLDRDGDGIGCE